MKVQRINKIEQLVDSYLQNDGLKLPQTHFTSPHSVTLKFKYIGDNDDERVAFVIYRKLKRFFSIVRDTNEVSIEFYYESDDSNNIEVVVRRCYPCCIH